MQRTHVINWTLQIWSNESGALTFETIVLTALLAFGIIAGAGTLRDALVNELADISGAIVSINQSYSLNSSPSIRGMPAQNNGSSAVDSSKRSMGNSGS